MALVNAALSVYTISFGVLAGAASPELERHGHVREVQVVSWIVTDLHRDLASPDLEVVAEPVALAA